VFSARPLPATTVTRNHNFEKEPLAGENLVPAKLARSGKENSAAFVPRSTIRAEERAMYDEEKAKRHLIEQNNQFEQRTRIIDQTKAEVKDLKKFIR